MRLANPALAATGTAPATIRRLALPDSQRPIRGSYVNSLAYPAYPQRVGSTVAGAIGLNGIGAALLAEGDAQAAIPQLLRACELSHQATRQLEGENLAPLSQAYTATGQREAARAAVETAFTRSSGTGTLRALARAHLANARLLIDEGKCDEALAELSGTKEHLRTCATGFVRPGDA